ncbi:MAG: hypothetical protein HZB59_08760 [Ignavibacteriales bacterium]|nr:hypothetical protein [Ignavibacteriales bacterium]
MKNIFLSALLITLLGTVTQASEKNDITRFYPKAESIAYYPKIEKSLKIICQKKIDNLWVSFIGYNGRNEIVIAAVTNDMIQNPNKEIYRILDFDEGSPMLGKVTTWGYVFDRNKDGKIDYLALVDGAAPFLDNRVPESYPARGQKLNRNDLELYINKCKIIFNHWADDNYDDKIDAVVHVDIDPLRDWVRRKIFARCTKFNNRFNDVFAFKNKISGEHEKIDYTSVKVPYRPLGSISGWITKDVLQRQTDILYMINRAVKECNAGKTLVGG